MRRTIYIATFNFLFFLIHNHFSFLLLLFLLLLHLHYYNYYTYIHYYIIIIITIIISGSSSSNSTSRSIIIIIIIIISSSSINRFSVLLTISTSIFELFICFLLFYINIAHYCLLRDHNGNKVTQLFRVIPAIAPYRELFYHNFQF